MLAAYSLSLATKEMTSLGPPNMAVVLFVSGDPSRSRELVRN